MKHISYSDKYEVAILIKEAALRKEPIQKEYIDPLAELGVNNCVAFSLTYDKKKPSAACRKEYLSVLLPSLKQIGVKTILCCDSEYFKTLTKQKKAEPHIGNILPCAIEDYEDMHVAYGINYQQFFYNPQVRSKLTLALSAIADLSKGEYVALGANVLRSVSYPKTITEISDALISLLDEPILTGDIEAFSLKHYDAGIGTISFSVDQHTAVAFPVDYVPCEPHQIDVWYKKDKKFKKKTAYGKQVLNQEVRDLLLEFFLNYKGKMLWYNVTYDVYVLIYQLFMKDLLDQEGMLYGMEVMLRDFECTQLITYLATNSCAGNKLSLKEQAHEFTGNYAQEEINDIRLIPLDILLEYNAIDTCATWFTADKRYPQMVLDDQYTIYVEQFKPAVTEMIQLQLTGICLDEDKVNYAEKYLNNICNEAISNMSSTGIVKHFVEEEKFQEVLNRNAEYKTKVITIDDAEFKFNPNSAPQLQRLLYTYMELPVIDLTDTKQAATGGKTLAKLINHTENQEYKIVIQALIDYALANKVVGTFIKAYKEAPLTSDGHHYLFGSFKLGGTVSSRLSSSGPNLQNQPSTGSPFAKVTKNCFVAPKGWVVAGLDYNSLEDYISALTTQDPMKLKVYTDGYCGHCLRAAYYFKGEMPDIDINSVESVNSIKVKYPHLRQKSKVPTFLLTYGGTWKGIVESLGFSEEEAKRIEKNYHDLYKVSDEWVKSKIDQAAIDGYITAAFGLRVRTPVLNQVVMGNSRTPMEAQGEGRTAGNALGQSWGALNTRAACEFMQKVRKSKYRLGIRPMAHIHDSQYYLVKDDFETLAFMNEHLVKAIKWQEAEEIKHETVKLGGDLSIFYPSWADEFEIFNGANADEIKQICLKEAKKRKEK